MLQAFRDVSYHAWLRGSLEGITPVELRNLLRFRDRFHRGVLTHVVLHAKLEARYADRTREVRNELQKAGFRKELVHRERQDAPQDRRAAAVERLERRPGAATARRTPTARATSS